MRIALAITSLIMGGAERQVVDLADRFSMLGHEVVIIYLTGDSVVTPARKDVQVFSVNMTRSPGGFIRGYFRVRALLKTFRPDVIHSHMVHANLLLRLVRLTLPMRRLICTAHNANEGGRLRMWAYRLTERLANLSTNVSQEAVEAFLAKGAASRGRMVAVSNGIDTTARFRYDPLARERIRSQSNVRPDTTVLLAAGRLTAQKDYPNLLRAFALLGRKFPDAALWIAGDGELRDELQQLAVALKISEKISFLGVRRNIHDYMSAADVFVLSSAFEGFGLVVAEAMACERIVVATDCGGVREVAGEAGILVRPADYAALFNGLSQAFSLSEKEKAFRGKSGREHIRKHYSIDAAIQRWLALYQA